MKIKILGVWFDRVGLEEAVKRIDQLIQTGGFHQAGTMNPEYLVRAQKDKRLASAIKKMALIVPDGVGIILAARFKGLGRLERIRGGDLVEALARLAAEKGYKIALVGGERGVAEKALTALQQKYPGLHVITSPRSDYQILFTALGFKGPVWIENLRKQNLNLVALEVGGVFNYLAGKSRQPPRLIIRAGLEWFWRLFWEPWRIKRQLSLLRFLFLVLKN